MNFNLVVDTSNFKPFTYQEKVAPLLLYKEAYDKQQEKNEKYAETLAELSPEMFRDAENRQAIQSFWDAFREASNSFSTGMTQENSAALNRLFIMDKPKMKRYQNAIKLRNEALQRRQNSGDDMVYNTTFAADDFLDMKDANIMGISKEGTFKKGAMVAASVFNMLKDPATSKLIGDIRDGYVKYADQGEDAVQAITKVLLDKAPGDDAPEGVRQAFEKIYNGLMRVVDSTGVNDPNNRFSQSAKKTITDQALLGFLSAFDQKVNYLTDRRLDVGEYNSTYQYGVDENGYPINIVYSTVPGSKGYYIRQSGDDSHAHTMHTIGGKATTTPNGGKGAKVKVAPSAKSGTGVDDPTRPDDNQ